jgi:hypothetical protein
MKIAICTPCHSDVSAEYAKSLATMIMFTLKARIVYNGEPVEPQIEIFMKTGSLLPKLRNLLVEDALDWGADYLLWIDSDHWFPDHSLMRLLSLNLPVVGVNYPRRAHPFLPTAVGLDGRHAWTTQELAAGGEVASVQSLGLGFCLIDMNAIRSLGDPRQSAEAGPFFANEILPDGRTILGEDVYFFARLRQAGFTVHLDHQLSWEIGHVSTQIVTNADSGSPS